MIVVNTLPNSDLPCNFLSNQCDSCLVDYRVVYRRLRSSVVMSYNYKKLCKFFRDLEESYQATPNATGAEGYIEEVALYYWYTYGNRHSDFIWATWFAIRLLIKNGFRPVSIYDVKKMRDEDPFLFMACYDYSDYDYEEDEDEYNNRKQPDYIHNLANTMLNEYFSAWAYNDMYKDNYVPYSFCSERHGARDIFFHRVYHRAVTV